jgi:FlaA1/EpsC-like NDP-sugar epimerase
MTTVSKTIEYRPHSGEYASRITVWLHDMVLFAVVGTLAFLLRFEFRIPRYYVAHLLVAVAVWAIVKPIAQSLGKLDRCQWRYTWVPDFLAIGRWNLVGSAASAVVIYWFGPPGFPRSIPIIDFLLCTEAVILSRILARLALAQGQRRKADKNRQRVFIYGAGYCGAMLLRELCEDPSLDYTVSGFIDDAPSKQGTLLQQVPVLGMGCDIPRLAEKWNVSLVLIAIPSCTPEQMTAVLLHCREAHVICRTVPGLNQLIAGQRFASQMRDISMDDVLGRKPVRLDVEHVRRKVAGQVVLVTGAAGSIGSELCRQLAQFDPQSIVGFDIAETALFHLDQEMRASFAGTAFHCAIGSIQNEIRLTEVLEQYRPSTVFHAAAYKHVPMMEGNIFEAVENNVLGTYKAAMAAAAAGVRDFVLISSDKAVNPANIMGATKRGAELAIAGVQQSTSTKFVAVRFGNVLGSNGSVVPIFRKQIAAGGPLTVTHPEMRRYFMTIAEAAQLVIQASTIGKAGEVMVLDMGEQVRIVDLARKLILLSGLRPDRDIQIKFSGIRPGEKLYEELNLEDERTVPTPHEKIRIFQGSGSLADVHERMRRLTALCQMRDAGGLLAEVRAMVPDYVPSPSWQVRRARSRFEEVHAEAAS